MQASTGGIVAVGIVVVGRVAVVILDEAGVSVLCRREREGGREREEVLQTIHSSQLCPHTRPIVVVAVVGRVVEPLLDAVVVAVVGRVAVWKKSGPVPEAHFRQCTHC